MNQNDEIQKILKSKYMKGPNLLISSDSIGINLYSGSKQSAFYELYGASTIFKLIILKPSNNLFITNYVGKGTLIFLLLDGEEVRGGFVNINESTLDTKIPTELNTVFPLLSDEKIVELSELWTTYVSNHYFELED